MTRPEPLDDAQLDRLLGAYQVPSLPPGLADRIGAEAAREDRVKTLSPFPQLRRGARRPWMRRGLAAGVIAINLIVASAIAATLSGHFPALRHIATAAANVLHLPHHRAAPHHLNRVTHVVPVHRTASTMAPPPPAVAAPNPEQIFAERHPLMVLRREGLIGPGEMRRERIALFAERHPRAAARRAHVLRMRALREIDFGLPAPIRADRPGGLDRVLPNPRLSAAGPRARMDERKAFEREREEFEQRANAKWPVKPAQLQDNPRRTRDKPIAESEHRSAHRAMIRRQWRERMRLFRAGHRRHI